MRSINYAEYSSDELWQLCKIHNDHKAFKVIYDREFGHLLSYGLKICKDHSDVKDALQEIFTDLWVKKSSRRINHIKLYLLKSLKYRLIKDKNKGKIIDINTLPKELSYTITPTNKELQSDEVKTILSQLPQNQQEILNLKYYQGLSNSQIAEVLDIKYQSVSNRLHRVLNVFRKKIIKKVSV